MSISILTDFSKLPKYETLILLETNNPKIIIHSKKIGKIFRLIFNLFNDLNKTFKYAAAT